MSQAACCTCATLLTAGSRVSTSSEKPLPDDRRLDCCGRIICGDCIHNNVRFLSYCPYCQTSGRLPLINHHKHRPKKSHPDSASAATSPSPLDPPPYTPIASTDKDTSCPPPPYTPTPSSFSPISTPTTPSSPPPSQASQFNPKHNSPQEETLNPHYTIHHLRHPPHPFPDTLLSLSLQYGIPLAVLRAHNRLAPDADYLLAARHTLLIPTACITRRPPNQYSPNHSGDEESKSGDGSSSSSSLSPHPVEDEAQRERKTAIRRWMVACKEADYDMAVTYLEECGWDLGEAVDRYWGDVEWERAHPLEDIGGGKGNGRSGRWRRGVGMRGGQGQGGGGRRGGTGGGGGGLLGWWKM
ncbi:hypothetical protein VTI74DRAFT_8199 [Chaetomium olivicolor]